MTASKISQIAALLNASERMDTQNKALESGLAFGSLLGQTSKGASQDLFSMGSLKTPTKQESASHMAYEKNVSQSGIRESSIVRKEAPDSKGELQKDTAEKLEAFEKKAVQEVAEKLGIPEEEVIEQMEAMGLTVLDLFDPSKLAGLVMGLTGKEEAGELLISGEFQELLSEVGELSKELMAELDLTPEGLEALAGQWKQMESQGQQAEGVVPGGEVQAEEMLQPETEADVEMEALQEDGEAKTPIPEEGKGMQQNAAAAQQAAKAPEAKQESVQQAAQGEQEQGEQPVAAPEEPVDGQETGNDTSQGKESSAGAGKEGADSLQKADTQQSHVTYQTTVQAVDQGQAMEVSQTVVHTKVDVDSIMRQISQMTRVVVTQAESSIEMQLNPANLGKVYLQVVSRHGEITAQLAAQNEAVKEALESQIAVLKENMNQQGLKVEAVEVTVASHGFEWNLEGNQQSPAQEQQQAGMGKTSKRSLNLNSLEELDGQMSEEESLRAKMMSEQGNSMDLTA